MPLPPNWALAPGASLANIDKHCTDDMFHIVVGANGRLFWVSTIDYSAETIGCCPTPVYHRQRVLSLCGKQLSKTKLCQGKHITHILIHSPAREYVGVGHVHGMFKLWVPWHLLGNIAGDILALARALWEPGEGEEMYPAPRRSERLKKK